MRYSFNMINKITKSAIVIALGLGFMSQTSLAATAASTTFSPKQKVAIEQIVHEYLVAHPVVLLEAAQALQKQQQKDMTTKAQSAIKNSSKALFNEPASPVIGDAHGNVTLVEFFDYQCSVCQRMAPVVNELMKKHPELRIVMKEWPIFGEASQYAAKATLASVKQDKFLPFYEALITNSEGQEGHLTTDQVDAIAKSAGVDVAQMQQDMKDPAYDNELTNNLKLAEAMHLVGTPAFVIAKTPNGVYSSGKVFFIPGGASEESLSQLIQQASA